MKTRLSKTTSRQLLSWICFLSIWLLSLPQLQAADLPANTVFAVTGTVTGASDGQPLIGATVMIKGSTSGTVTDYDGNYSLDVPSANDTLVFSYSGFSTQEVPVNGQSVIDVVLTENASLLDEVVVIGYGSQSRKVLTSSIAKVDAEDIEDLEVTTIGAALQGKAAGVSISSGTGQPGATPTIRIRGGSSINRSNDPLFIIDGVQRSPEDFNPDDVESIEVLKDAAATAIYGARASNGVVLITTKTGKAGQAKFNVNYRSSYSSLLNELDLLNAEDYLRIQRVGLTRSFLNENSAFGTGATALGTGNGLQGIHTTRILAAGETVPEGYQTMEDPVTGETLIFQDTDWQEELYRTAQIDNLNFSVNGGSDKVTYYLGAAYLNQEGIARTTNYARFSLQSNVNFQINDKLKISTNINATRSNSNEPFSTSAIFQRGMRVAPTTRFRYDDGSLAQGSRSNLPNPLFFVENYVNDESINKLNLGARAQYDIIDGLQASVTGNYFTSQQFRESFVRANPFTSARRAGSSLGESRQTQFEGTLRYLKSFGSHNLTALVGASRLETNFFNFSGNADGGSTDNIFTLNAAPNILGLSTSRAADLLIGVFGRVSYDFDQKYLLSATVRRDGSSRFGANNRVGYFPSASAGWRISEEDFFNNNGVLSEMKVRASWGQTGNNDVGLFTAQGVVNPGFIYAGQAAARATAVSNLDLGWEKTTQTGVGLELGLLDNRITLLADYYVKETEDLLFSRPLPNTSGYGSVTENIGTVRFKGLEFALSTENIRGNAFNWTTDFNIAFNSNEIIKLPENDLEGNRIGGVLGEFGGLAEGEPLGNVYGWQYLGVYATTAEAEADGLLDLHANNRTGNNGIDYRMKVGGDVRWQDTNGDGNIDFDDQVELGNVIPNITGGIGNTFSYKGLELYVFMDFALGHVIMNNNRARMNSNSQGNINGTSDLLNAWENEGDVTDVPRFVFFDFGNARNFDRNVQPLAGGGNHSSSSQYVEKGDYLSLRTLRLSYNLPRSLTERLRLGSVKAYVAGQNLHYFTSYRGLNPEYNPNISGIDNNQYPLFRSLSFGLNVGF